ncbi:cupin domain-containing protein [Poritiphilus flavus]|uniref:Cupin type-2 domain-containing protein n=1 Tax=Poritiphilus flavus TaxID=2697053 RepID=A0A6L9E728_9FLAO|nr:cupin domain-containing protein [Poritiphilus flavus]NAS10490.1 hypothetical protein [Poritiphilus flavus]
MFEINNSINNLGYRQLLLQKLVKTNNLEILLISLEKGTVFPDHSSPKDAELVVLEGLIDFHIRKRVYQLKKHQHFSFPKEEVHSVTALEDTKFLIIR